MPASAVAPVFAFDPAYRLDPASHFDTPVPVASEPGTICPKPETLTLIRSRAGFDALEAAWNDLYDRAGRPEQMFQTFNWLWHWANAYLTDEDNGLAIVTATRAGMLVAILPLLRERAFGLTQLAFMGDPVSQYGDAIAEPMPGQAALLERALSFAIAETGADLVRLTKVREDALMAPVVKARHAQVTGVEIAPYADLAAAGSLNAYNARFSSKTLKNRRRQGRRLEDHGKVALDWSLSGTAAADAARLAMILKRAWLKVRGQLSRAFADRRTDRFFADVCSGYQRPAGVEVTLLTSGGEIANAAITVTSKGRQSLHILAYGLKFEKCAPGVLHVERLIERAFANGISTLDFLAPRHDYKLEWADGSTTVADYALPVTLAGRSYARFYLGFIRQHAKAFLQSAPRRFSRPLSILQAALQRIRR